MTIMRSKNGESPVTDTRNATITSTHLGYEDHGVLTAWVFLKYEGSGQGFGGYSLGAHMEVFVKGVIDAVGADRWEDLPGKHLRVEAGLDGVLRIGHIIEDRWFEPADAFAAARAGASP